MYEYPIQNDTKQSDALSSYIFKFASEHFITAVKKKIRNSWNWEEQASSWSMLKMLMYLAKTRPQRKKQKLS